MKTIVFLLCLSLASWSADATAKGDTIKKVVELLNNMLEKSQKDGEEERVLWATYKCSCTDQKQDFEDTIKEAKAEIERLEASIEKSRGSNGEESLALAEATQAKEDAEQRLSDLTAIREKENKLFLANKLDLETAIKQLGEAIKTLSEVGGDQTKKEGVDHTKFMGTKFLQKKTDVLRAVENLLSSEQKKTVESLLQMNGFGDPYTSQSGEVVGILLDMKDTFKADLKAAIAAEAKAKAAFEKVKANIEKEIKLLESSIAKNEKEMSGNDGQLKTDREQLKDAKDTLEQTTDLLEELTARCAAKAAEWEERKVARANEEVAIAKAISILNSDDAFATFTRDDTGKWSFLQVSSETNDIKAIQEVLLDVHSLRLRRIARLLGAYDESSTFGPVLEAIDGVLEDIEAEGKADKKQKKWCEDSIEKHDAIIKDQTQEINEQEKEIAKLKKEIKTLKQTIEELKGKIAKNREDLQDAKDQRAKEHMAYTENVASLEKQNSLLQNAIDVLSEYYDTIDEPKAAASDAPDHKVDLPDTWEDGSNYQGHSKSGNSAIKMLEAILKDSETTLSETHETEEKAQAAFDKLEAKLEKAFEQLTTDLNDTEESLADAIVDLKNAEEALALAEKTKKASEDYLEKISPGCEFIDENFDTRVKNRAAEVTGLKTAIKKIKASPRYIREATQHKEMLQGDCAGICKENEKHAKCQACLSKVTVEGWCAGHKDAGAPGCS